MHKLVLEIARHELATTFRTRRAVALAVVYLSSALMAGLSYVLSLRFIEQQALDALVQAGVEPLQATSTLSVATTQAYAQLVSFFADVPVEELSPLLKDSLVLPAFLWGSLAFLPFLVVLTSYDLIAADLSSRSILYSTLRAPRRSVLFGKLSAQLVLFVGLTVLASLALVGLAGAMLRDFAWGDTLLGLVRVWAGLLAYGACYLGLAAFCSTTARQPSSALFAAIGLMIVLRVVGLTRNVADPTTRMLSYLSPARYQGGMWEQGYVGPLSSAAAYLLFAAIFVALAAWRLSERDL